MTTQWAKETYNTQYDKWVPWLEDLYLRYFTSDNKASYTTKQNLDKTKVTGIKQIDTLQDGIHNLVGGQVGQGGLGQPIGDALSKEGINRAERKGKDDSGSYAPGALGTVVNPVVDGSKGAAGAAQSGLQSAGGAIGSLWGGQKQPEQKQ